MIWLFSIWLVYVYGDFSTSQKVVSTRGFRGDVDSFADVRGFAVHRLADDISISSNRRDRTSDAGFHPLEYNPDWRSLWASRELPPSPRPRFRLPKAMHCLLFAAMHLCLRGFLSIHPAVFQDRPLTYLSFLHHTISVLWFCGSFHLPKHCGFVLL